MQFDIPPGWHHGSIVIDGQSREAAVRLLRGQLRVETTGARIALGQVIDAWDASWTVVAVEERERGVIFSVCDLIGGGS